MTMLSNLNCPVCGHTALVTPTSPCAVACTNAECEVHGPARATPEEAAVAWNAMLLNQSRSPARPTRPPGAVEVLGAGAAVWQECGHLTLEVTAPGHPVRLLLEPANAEQLGRALVAQAAAARREVAAQSRRRGASR